MIITLDAGHYGKYNRSPAVPAYYESVAMWTLHLYLKEELESLGITVRLTRQEQSKDMEVSARGKCAKGSDLFLSLHSNAVGSSTNESVDYPVCYVPMNGSGNAIGLRLAETVGKIMQTKQDGRIATRAGNNGDYYGVIRGAVGVGVPGIIIEHSFHTQTRATNWLLQDHNLRALAKAEAHCIAKYYGIPISDSNNQKQEDETMTAEQFRTMMNNYRAELQDNDNSTWSEESRKWAAEQGIITGGGNTADGEPNYMWEDFLTREQAVVMLYRFARMMGTV